MAAGLAVALAVAVASLGAYVVVRANLRGDVDDALRRRAAGDVGAVLRDSFRPETPFGGPPRRGEPTVYAQLVRADGVTREPPEGGISLRVDGRTLAVAEGRAAAYLSDQTVSGTHLRVITTPLIEGYALQIARPLEEVDSLLANLRLILVMVAGGGVVMGGGLGWFISGRALRPVARFTEQTEAVAGAPDVTARLEVEGDDELGRLAASFNTTLDALEQSVEAQRQLVADASHELRTPIASLRTNIEVLQKADGLAPADREELLADLVTQADELTGLVGDVVDVARRRESDADMQEVNLHEVVEGVVARARRLSPQSDIVEELSPWVVSGAPERLTRLVTNLVDNAVKWSPPGGRIEVRLTGGELSVRDHGPGIDPADLPHVFDRFYRATAARGLPGSGLGLAIVRQVAAAHGATAIAENAEGGGARFRITFPAAS
ncbi:MAG: HAMP domain-containing sensor histidine kinase [Actinomycetota bacterium]